MTHAPSAQRVEPKSRWAIWLDRLFEGVVIVFFWGYAASQDFALVPLAAAVLVTCWIVGTRLWRFLRGEEAPRQTAPIQPSDRWTSRQIAGLLFAQPWFSLILLWALAAKEGLTSFWGAVALGMTAYGALVTVQVIRAGPNPPEPEIKGRIDEVPLHHDDANVRHDFPGMR